MSTAKGGVHSRAPKHQNSFAFKHNKNSKKTRKIAGIHHNSLCKRCQEQIQWRKKFRKYKPRKAPGKCRGCELKKITLAYHVLCNTCAEAKKVCPKCTKSEPNEAEQKAAGGLTSATGADNAATDESIAKRSQVEHLLPAGMKERERRTILRKVDKGEMMIRRKEHDVIELVEIDKSTTDAGDSDLKQPETKAGD